MKHRTVTTPELRTGDIVNCHGLRCLIDGEIKVSLTHPDDRGTVHYTRALVLNRDEVSPSIVPLGYTTADKSRGDADGEHRWTIQGNDLARWNVEEASA
jgi:hypothetical protein